MLHLFDVEVTMDGRGQGLGEDVKDIPLLLGKLLALLHVLSWKHKSDRNRA